MRTRSENTNKKFRWKWLIISLSTVAAVIVGLTVYWGVGVYSALDDFSKPPEDSRFNGVEPETPIEVPKWEGKERVNILLLGGDARDAQEGEIARSDSLLVASFDPVTKKAHLFSVLRDTYGPIEGHGRGRINTAITMGGPKLAMKTVGDLLGLEVQYYVYTDFEGFKSLIDTIGGIWFEVEKDMYYTDNADGNRYDIDLKKGHQLLDGDKALQYVRFRHDALSDYTRTERQRNFLKAVATELQSTWNLIRMKQILESVSPYIETNLTVGDMLKLGQLGVESNVGGSAQIPPMELVKEENVGGASVIGIRDLDALLGYVQEVLSADDTQPEPSESPASGEGSGSESSTGGNGGSAASRGTSASVRNDAGASRGDSPVGSVSRGDTATSGSGTTGTRAGSSGNGAYASTSSGSSKGGSSASSSSGSSKGGGPSSSTGGSAASGGGIAGSGVSSAGGGASSSAGGSSANGGGIAGSGVSSAGGGASSSAGGSSANGGGSSDSGAGGGSSYGTDGSSADDGSAVVDGGSPDGGDSSSPTENGSSAPDEAAGGSGNESSGDTSVSGSVYGSANSES